MTLTPAIYAAALYVGLAVLVAVWIGYSVGSLRGKLGISIGDGGEPRLIRAMRGHANFSENTPLALIVIAMSAILGAPSVVIHALGLILIVSRILHGMHFLAEDAPAWQRFCGAIGTALVLALGGIGLSGHALLMIF